MAAQMLGIDDPLKSSPPLVTCGQQAFHSWDCMAQVAVFWLSLGDLWEIMGHQKLELGRKKR